MTVWQPYNVMDKMRLYMCGCIFLSHVRWGDPKLRRVEHYTLLADFCHMHHMHITAVKLGTISVCANTYQTSNQIKFIKDEWNGH